MGYSCTAIASLTLESLLDIVRDTESSNVYRGRFIERGRENDDGAITGTVYTFIGTTSCKRSGSYKINAEGKIERFPGTTKAERMAAEKVAKDKFVKMYPTFA